MIARSSAVAILMVALLCLGLLLPVSADEADVQPETVTDTLDGVPAADAATADAAGAGSYWTASAEVSTMPYSFVGVSLPEDAEGEFRYSADGETWSEWGELETFPDEGPDYDSEERSDDGRVYSEGDWVGEANYFQARVHGAAPEDLEVRLIDSAGLSQNVVQRITSAIASAWKGSGQAASASVSQPDIVSRADWGADEDMRGGDPSYADDNEFAVVHHTAGNNNYSEAEAPAVVRGIYDWHVNGNGWNDIGYNILVDRYGNAYEGRYGGLEEAVIGAHAAGFNTGSYGISVMGNFDGQAPPEAARYAVRDLLVWKHDVHHIDASAELSYTSRGSDMFPEGQEVEIDTVIGHRDVGYTDCPGGAYYATMPALLRAVDDRQSDMFVSPEVAPDRLAVDGGEITNGPVEFSAGLKPSGAWDLTVYDPDGAVAATDSGNGASLSSSWTPDAATLGEYTYEITGGNRRPVTGTIDVTADVLTRVGDSSNPSSASVSISRAAFSDAGAANRAVIARNDVFADAMTGGPLAGDDGTLLLTGADELDASVAEELDRVLASDGQVYVLGGTNALDDSVVAQVREAIGVSSDSDRVQRVSGPERAGTSAAVAEIVLERSGTDTVMVARYGPDDQQPWADALSGGAYGAAEGIPVLLSRTDDVPTELTGVLSGVGSTIVLGGTQAISESVAGEFPDPTRVSGADRSGTAAAVAARLWGRSSGSDGDKFTIGGGYSSGAWAYALAAAPLAARNNAPLVLVFADDDVPPETEEYLDALGYGSGTQADGWVLGPSDAVSDSVADDVTRLLQ